MTRVTAGVVQVVRASLEASVADLQVVQGSIIINTHQHLPEADVSSEAAACLAAFLAEHLRVSPSPCAMRFGSTTKVLGKRILKYYRVS